MPIHYHDPRPMNAGEEREFITNLTAHLNEVKPKHFAICVAHEPCDCGRVPEGDVLAYGVMGRRGVALLEDDGTLLGLYETLDQAHARATKGYGNPRTFIAWMTPELIEPPTAFPAAQPQSDSDSQPQPQPQPQPAASFLGAAV